MTVRTKTHRCKLIAYRILCNEKFKAQVSSTGRWGDKEHLGEREPERLLKIKQRPEFLLCIQASLTLICWVLGLRLCTLVFQCVAPSWVQNLRPFCSQWYFSSESQTQWQSCALHRMPRIRFATREAEWCVPGDTWIGKWWNKEAHCISGPYASLWVSSCPRLRTLVLLLAPPTGTALYLQSQGWG